MASNDLDSVGKLIPSMTFGNLVVPVEATSISLGGLGERDYHGERSFVRKASIGADRRLKAPLTLPSPKFGDGSAPSARSRARRRRPRARAPR